MLLNKKQSWDNDYGDITAAPKTAAPVQPVNAPRRHWLNFVCLVALATLLALSLISRHAAVISKGYELVKLRAEAMQLERENEALRLEIARLKAPQRITDIAVHRLGMVQPQNVYYATKTHPASTSHPQDYAQAPLNPPTHQSVVQKLLNFLGQHRAEASKGQ